MAALATLPTAIVDLDDYTESINMLVYGDSGVGKTVLAGSKPRTLIVAAETGTISAKRQGSQAKAWPVSSWSDFEAAYDWVDKNPTVFDWIAIDSATEVQNKLLRMILDGAVRENPSRDPDIPAIQDHQKWQNMFKRYVSLWNELPVNVLWTAQAMHKEDQEGEDIVLPLILGKNYDISSWLCAQMGIVAFMRTKRVKVNEQSVMRRELICKSIPPYFAKDRYDALGTIVRNPTMAMIESKIENEPAPTTASAKKAAAAKKIAAEKPSPVEPIDDDNEE